ncbi:MAG: tRNA guanosine(15) transglycosylase TgtA [Nitrososphaerota archaeon]|nr:tRNA guanosine(15) transglycosylase TgtA [Nitrososphaerota archaeon]
MTLEFEVRDRDLLGRIGKLYARSGNIETPAFLPVINPSKLTITPKEMWEDFDCKILITNAYLIKKYFSREATDLGIHAFLDFPGIVVTDSGAYQILSYGKVDVTPEEIIRFQEKIGSDIATILDLPTGWRVSRDYAQFTVDETVRRAEKFFELKSRGDIGWIGPIQGGRYLDVLAMSASKMGKFDFDVYALGSPTPVMEQYLFSLLTDMIVTAKMNLPINRPFHLFGAGHPFMFGIAVALGCDLFDSAAYSLFAYERRYLTDRGTVRLDRLEYLPCSCPICVKRSARELNEMPDKECEKDLAKHNLYICFSEIKRIKQAIVEGRLWEYVEMRAHGHPSLLDALKNLKRYERYIEKYSPVSKRSGFFFFSSVGLSRPEVSRYHLRLMERFAPNCDSKFLFLVPRDLIRKGRSEIAKVISSVCERLRLSIDEIQLCIYFPPFGVIPMELTETYPAGQTESISQPDRETIEYMIFQVIEFARHAKIGRVIMLAKKGTWQDKVAQSFGQSCTNEDFSFKPIYI